MWTDSVKICYSMGVADKSVYKVSVTAPAEVAANAGAISLITDYLNDIT